MSDSGVDPRTEEEMRAFWDSRARDNAMYYIHSTLDYDSTDAAEFWTSGAGDLDRTLAPFGVAFKPTDAVVEIGCGMGRLTRHIAARSASVIGIDVSPEMIERATEANAAITNAQFRVGSGSGLDGIDDASMDAAYSLIVFQHIPDPEITCQYLREIGRVLKPGGWAAFQVSELPEIHKADFYDKKKTWKDRLSRSKGGPTGCLDAAWLGSALKREQLVGALSDGGMSLVATYGDGTQYCMVHAVKN